MSKKYGTIGPLTYVDDYFGLVDKRMRRMICGEVLRDNGYKLSYKKTYYIKWSIEKPKHDHYIVFEWRQIKAIVDGECEITTFIFDHAMKDAPTNIPLYGWIEEEV